MAKIKIKLFICLHTLKSFKLQNMTHFSHRCRVTLEIDHLQITTLTTFLSNCAAKVVVFVMFVFLSPVLFFSIKRYMMEKMPHLVCLGTSHMMACLVTSSTVHPITYGWSLTAMLLEPIRAFASPTQVSYHFMKSNVFPWKAHLFCYAFVF